MTQRSSQLVRVCSVASAGVLAWGTGFSVGYWGMRIDSLCWMVPPTQAGAPRSAVDVELHQRSCESMTADREGSGGVRLHVGGLARGVEPKDLAALIARALPDGAEPTAEIMRDASTGIERGFGYVSIPAGEGIRAGVERAIVAYNGTRWRGNKIRVDFAKGDYLQRLKAEWDEAAQVKAAAAAAAAATAGKTSVTTAPYKARPFLRLRRRPGERTILVDPTPIAWTKPPRQDDWARSKNKVKEDERAHEGRKHGGDEVDRDEDEEATGPHRRKRGLLGSRRRVEFPGAATCSTKCRDLWRRHLQERAAETSAARLRSVDRFVEGKRAAEKREAAAAAAAAASTTVVNVPNGQAAPRAKATEREEYLADLAPEEPPSAEDIEFVWDGDAEGEAGSGSESGMEADADGDEGSGDGDSDGDGDLHDGEQPVSLVRWHDAAPIPEESVGQEPPAVLVQAEESDGGEMPHAAGRSVAESDDCPAVPKASGLQGGTHLRSCRAGSKNLARLGKNHGLELDDRLLELLSDGSDDEGDGQQAYGNGGFDYELETAKEGGAAAASAAAEETVEGMRERLQAETERSLRVLAGLFGGANGTGPLAKEELLSVNTGQDGMEGRGGGGGSGGSLDGRLEEVEPESYQHHQGPESPAEAGGTRAGPKAEAPDEKRFVAHMSTLTDIFKVEDKVSTKKNREEKEKDKGFKVASLFDKLEGTGEGAVTGAADGTDGFSFALGRGGACTFAADSDRVGVAGTVSAHGKRQEGVSISPHEAGPPTATSTITAADSGHSTGNDADVKPALAAPYDGSAFPGTDRTLWRPLAEIVAIAARFVRTGPRNDVEAAWLEERRALTQDFKRKHKDAVKGRRGAGGSRGTASKKRRR